MMQNYTELMIQIAVKLGAHPSLAEREMKEAMELETKLVNFSADEQIRRDPDHVYNPFQLDKMKELFPFVSFLMIFLKFYKKRFVFIVFNWIKF
jgi:hypothetical protein